MITEDDDDLRYLFTLASVTREADGTFTLRAPSDSGREIFGVPAERALRIVAAKWGGPVLSRILAKALELADTNGATFPSVALALSGDAAEAANWSLERGYTERAMERAIEAAAWAVVAAKKIGGEGC